MSAIPKIAIAVHSYGNISPEVYANHIAVFSMWSKDYNTLLFHVDRVNVASARNRLVEAALKQECTHILFIDTDHIIDGSMLPCLLGNTDATAVSGLIVKRDGSGNQVGFIKADEDYSYHIDIPIDGNSYDVDTCAFGCTLIDLSVFAELEKPYFKDQMLRNKEGKLYQKRSDIHFCVELKELGKIIRIDTRVLIGHQGNAQVYYPEPKTFQLASYYQALEFLKENSTVIDFGCGDAKKLLKYIKPHCSRVIGIDQEQVIAVCRTKAKDIVWHAGDVQEPQDIGTGDIIICADVLEHVKDVTGTINNLKNAMTPDSVLVVSTPNVDTVPDDIKINTGHVNFWNKEQFVKVLEDNNLDVVSVKQFNEIIKYKSIVCVCKLKSKG